MKHQDASKEKKEHEELFKISLFVLAPLFLIYQANYQNKALQQDSWTRLRLSRYRSWQWVYISIISTLCLLILTIHLLTGTNPKYAVFTYIAALVSQFPLANLYLLHLMNSLVVDNQSGKVDPNVTYSLRRARYEHGASYSEKIFGKMMTQLEIPRNFIGLRVEPYWQEIPLLGEPGITKDELEVVLADRFSVFPLNRNAPDHHLVVGQSGSGKTTLITRMVKAGLLDGWKVIVLDLKGDPSDVDKFLRLEKDQSKVRHFPTSSFNFWKGTKQEIAERIISFLPIDGEPYYLNRNINAIQAVILRVNLDTPKSVDELVGRLRIGFTIAGTSSDLAFFATKERGQPIGEIIANDVMTYLDPIRNLENRTPQRFHWSENWHLALFTLDGFEPSSLRVADAILHDFASWIFSDERAMNKMPILLIVDEASAFSALPQVPILSALIQRARSAQVSLVFASQNLSAFKNEKDNLLHSGAIRWLGSSTQVDEMIEAAGTRGAVEAGFQFSENQYTGTVTHRNQKEFKIDPDFVKELRTFHWYVSSRGKVSLIFVPPFDWN